MRAIFLLFVAVLLGANTANGCSGGGDDHGHDHTGNLVLSLKSIGSAIHPSPLANLWIHSAFLIFNRV